MKGLARYFPILEWGREYNAATFADDMIAAVIVTIMLIPQSLAYALLAGMPPEAGLYASIAPLIVYAIFGASRALAVGPVAVISLMTATAIGRIAEPGSIDYLTAAFTLAVLSGIFLFLLGLFRLGSLANLLSHPVVTGFVAASGVLIAASQLRHILGIGGGGENFVAIVVSIAEHINEINIRTTIIGVGTIILLYWARKGLKPLLLKVGMKGGAAGMAAKTAPVIAVILSTLAAAYFHLPEKGVAIVGDIPRGLPPFTPPSLDPELWSRLAGSAALISIIGFVSTISVAQALAAKRRQRVDPNQELIGLGASNIAAGLSGGFPITGGFARSVVNFDAGARTPAAGAFTAVGILLAALFLTPLLYNLPKATLAATIIVAVISIIEAGALLRTWRFSKSDGGAMAATIVGTLAFGVEMGLVAGVVLSLGLHIKRTSAPHCAIVGQVPGTEHFRNVDRHAVVTNPKIMTLRVDESLYFANSRFLEDKVYALVAAHPEVKDFIIMCAAVNDIDSSGLESLEAINQRLKDSGVTFHLSEVKGPVMDRLKRSSFLDHLSGRVFLTQFGAVSLLDPETARATLAAAPDLQFQVERGSPMAAK